MLPTLWKWRCAGQASKPHKSYEVITDYRGRKVTLPRARSWGKRLLPFERARIRALPADAGPDRKLAILGRCPNCGTPVEADTRGPGRWRLHCQKRCIEPYYVDKNGDKIELHRQGIARMSVPRKARRCPRPSCGRFLTLAGRKWRNRRTTTAYPETLVRLVCLTDGKRSHMEATFYFDLEKEEFLKGRSMRPGRQSGDCPVRRRCCGRAMWASFEESSAREVPYWWLTCANPNCTKGRQGKRRYLKVGLNRKCLPWLKPAVT